MASKIKQQDFSGWTFQPVDETGKVVQPQAANASPSPGQTIVQQAIPQSLQVTAPAAQPANQAPPLPDITTQEPNTFASLNANLARSRMANPTVDDYNKVYEESLSKSQDYWKTLSTQFQQQKTELAKATQLQQSAEATDIDKATKLAPLEVQKAVQTATQTELAKMPIDAYKAQMAEGLTPDAALAQYKSAHPDFQGTTAPLIKALPTTESDKAAGFINGYKTATNLHQSFENMRTKTFGASGNIMSTIAGVVAPPSLTSPEAINYNALVDSSLVPLAKGVYGDAGTTAGKETIQSKMMDSLPQRGNSELVGGQKIYNLKRQIIDNLETQRAVLAGHYDTSSIDTALAGMHADLKSMGKFNPVGDQTAVVQSGLSPQGTAHINSAAGAGATPTPAGTPAPANPAAPNNGQAPVVPPPQTPVQGAFQLYGAGTT